MTAACLFGGSQQYPGAGAPFYLQNFHKGELNITHLFGLKGAIERAPWLWNSPIYIGYVLIGSFF